MTECVESAHDPVAVPVPVRFVVYVEFVEFVRLVVLMPTPP